MRAFLLDIDGTTLLGARALPGARAFVDWMRAEGIPHVWLTNNTSRSRGAWLARLRAAGIEASGDEIYTAGDATIDFLRSQVPAPRVHLVGTRDLRGDFEAAGLPMDDDQPECVVVGYDTELTYAKIRRAALFLQRGLPYYATHPDVTCPTPQGPVPDVGSFLAMFDVACGRRPQVLGKPEPSMAYGALKRLGVSAHDACMVGDRLETDVRMATRAGLTSCLVLTGVAGAAQATRGPDRPTCVLETLADVHRWARTLG